MFTTPMFYIGWIIITMRTALLRLSFLMNTGDGL